MIAMLCVVVSALFSLQPSPLVETGGLPSQRLSPVSQLPRLELDRLDAPSQFRLVGQDLPANQTGTFTLTNALGDSFSYIFTTSPEGEVDLIKYVFAEADTWQVSWQVARLSGRSQLVWAGELVGLELANEPVTSPEPGTSSMNATAPEVASPTMSSPTASSPTASSPETTSADTSPLNVADEASVTDTADTETLELTSPSLDEASPDDTSLATETSVNETSAESASPEESSSTEIITTDIVTTETASPDPLPAEVAPTETPSPAIRLQPPAWLVALGRSSWYLTFAVVLAIIGLRLTLLCKYWVAQSEDIEAYWREHKHVPKLARLNIMNYFSVAEKLTLLGLFVVALVLTVLAQWEDGGFTTSLSAALQQAVRNPWAALAGANPPQLASLVWQVALSVFFVAAVIHLVGLVLPRPQRAQSPKSTPLYGLFAFLIPGSALAARGYGILLLLAWVAVGTSVLRQLYNLPDILNLGVWGGFWALGSLYGINLLLLLTHYILGRRKKPQVLQAAKV